MRTDYVVFVVDCRFVSSLSIRQTNCNDFEVQFNFPTSGWIMRTQMNNFLIQMAFLPIRFELEIGTKQLLRMKTFLLKIEMHASAPSSSWCWTSLWQRITFSFSAECGKMRSMRFVYVIIFEWRFGGLCKYLCERVSESLTFNNILIWSAICWNFILWLYACFSWIHNCCPTQNWIITHLLNELSVRLELVDIFLIELFLTEFFL